MSQKSCVVCLSYFQAKPEFRDELVEELLKLVEPTRDEPGCILYELLADDQDPNYLIMLEKFTSDKALDLHEKQPYIVRFVKGPMLKYCEKVTWNVARGIGA
jgi:quinol monooxygenase YgiN